MQFHLVGYVCALRILCISKNITLSKKLESRGKFITLTEYTYVYYIIAKILAIEQIRDSIHLQQHNIYLYIIESVDSISRDERDAP